MKPTVLRTGVRAAFFLICLLFFSLVLDASRYSFAPRACAEDAPVADSQHPPVRDVPVSEEAHHNKEVMSRVNGLVNQLTQLGDDLKQGMPDDEMRTTVKRLDATIDNASKLLAPDSGITQKEERITAKLQDAMEQMNDLVARVQQGQGSAGMFLKDPELTQLLKEVGVKLQKLQGHRREFRFDLDIGLEEVKGYSEGTSRVYMNLGIWPADDHYYLLGFANDPRGKLTVLHTTAVDANGNQTTTDTQRTDETALVFTGMYGRLYLDKRLDLSLGILYGDLALSAAFNLGPKDFENHLKLRADLYTRAIVGPTDGRFTLDFMPWKVVYVSLGLDSVHRVDGTLPWMYGAGISFDDSFIKYLFNTYIANAI
jgi:hypothetical protein